MLNLSIIPLHKDHINERCQDIIEQQKNGVSTHALFMMTFNPEFTPALDKATEQCKIYDDYREILDKAGVHHGVLVQATLGHITVPREPYPFTPSISLITGEDRVVTCCPLDPDFQEYIKRQFKTLAAHKPEIVMIDDDLGLLYKATKGCACKYHLSEFNKRAATNMSREELYAHTQGTSETDKYYTNIYVETQKHGLVSVVKKMREGLDEIDPTIQGIVSGIYTGTFCEFSGDIAQAFAGKGNHAIMRLNGGPYGKDGPRTFTTTAFQASILKENVKDKVDVFLAETDTCPHNRYSTSAAYMHSHFTSSILQGATGAKHWITRLERAFEPSSGIAYRKILSKHEKFYERLVEYTKDLKPFGCKIPLTLMQNYGFVPSTQPKTLSPWSSCFLERTGLPLYFSNDEGGAAFLDDFSADGFDGDELLKLFSQTLVLSGIAAKKLYDRGYGEYIGVKASDVSIPHPASEIYNGNEMQMQYEAKMIEVTSPHTEVLSTNVRWNSSTKKYETISPAVTHFNNSLGGETIVFCGTPDMPYAYFTAYSLLNETRKKQFIEMLSKRNHIPIYYPGDAEIYLRAGYLKDGTVMAVLFNIGLDVLDEIPITYKNTVTKVEKLNADGLKSECKFEIKNDVIKVSETLQVMNPVVLFFS